MPEDNPGKKIMVIDDEPSVRRLLKNFLEEQGFRVILESDGSKALERVPEILPDILIMDLLLPGEHGIDLVKTVKEKYFIPVIIITGIYHREEIKDTMDEYFVEGFLRKPFKLDELLENINNIIEKRTV
jgi:DNA-binding response OmpR family regulator